MAAYFITLPRKPYEAQTAFNVGDAARGEYTFAAAGCGSCHLSSVEEGVLSGGVVLEPPFGSLVAPNISPSKTAGIGGWSDSDFLNAVKAGISPDGEHYYPGFPYARFAGLKDRDVLDIKAFIDATPDIKYRCTAAQPVIPL